MTDNANKKFDFWNDHSLAFLEMAMTRDYQEKPVAFDGYGKRVRECGDAVELFLSIREGRIQFISYDIQGCLFSHACANTLIKLVKGKTIEQAADVDKQMIIDFLQTLPVKEEHCADHVLIAFKSALEDFQSRQSR